MMCEKCTMWAGDGEQNTVRMIVGHHPNCPDFAVGDITEFCSRLEIVAQQIAERKLIAEIPKLRKELAKDFGVKPEKPKTVLSEKLIQNLIYYARAKDRVVVPNAKFFCGENDIISVTEANYVYEFEIKISRSDFKKDFEKHSKHNFFRRCYIEKFRTPYYSYPNYFYYVVPDGMIAAEDVPEYAGLMTVLERNHSFYPPTVKKKAPLLHKDKITERQLQELFHKCYYRFWNLRTKN